MTSGGTLHQAVRGYSPAQVDAFYANGWWTDVTVSDLVDRWGAETPERVFIHDGDVALTFGRLRDDVRRLAASLRRLGFVAGDRVAVQLPNWHEMVVTYLALARLGVVLVPLMPVYRDKEVGYIVERTRARAIVTTTAFRGFSHVDLARRVKAASASIEHLVVVRASHDPSAGEMRYEDLLRNDTVPRDEDLGPRPLADDPHIIGFTSGTESRAKGCLHSWNTYSFNPRSQVALFGFASADVELVVSPITHSAGLGAGILKPLVAGGACCLVDVWDPDLALQLIDRHRCTTATGATTFVAMLADAYDPARHDASTFRQFLCGGAPVPGQIVQRVEERLPSCIVLPCFGQTETVLNTTCMPDDPQWRRCSTDGRPLPGVEMAIADPNGVHLPPGVQGEILYRGPGAMLEYWEDPAASAAAATADGWLRSGDLGVIDSDGYLRVTGRTKDVIIRGGMNLSAVEMEEMLLRHPLVHSVAVVGESDPVMGERACAFVVPQPGGTPTLAELVAFLAHDLGAAKQKLPERLLIVDHLPMNSTGKVLKNELRERLARLADAGLHQ